MWHLVAFFKRGIPGCESARPSLLGIYATERIAKLFMAAKSDKLARTCGLSKVDLRVERAGTTFLVR